jgi:hypothetical protein
MINRLIGMMVGHAETGNGLIRFAFGLFGITDGECKMICCLIRVICGLFEMDCLKFALFRQNAGTQRSREVSQRKNCKFFSQDFSKRA